MSVQRKVRLFIDRKTWDKLMFITKETAPNEVSGVGTAVFKGNDVYITGVHLLEQKVNLAETTLSPEAIAHFLVAHHDDGSEEQQSINFWWHTHGDAEVFWSGIDEGTCDVLVECGTWFVSIVLNTMGKVLGRLDGVADFGKFAIELPVHILSTLDEKEKKELSSQIGELVEEVKDTGITVDDYEGSTMEGLRKKHLKPN